MPTIGLHAIRLPSVQLPRSCMRPRTTSTRSSPGPCVPRSTGRQTKSLHAATYWPCLRGMVTFCMVSRMRPCCGSLTNRSWRSSACFATLERTTRPTGRCHPAGRNLLDQHREAHHIVSVGYEWHRPFWLGRPATQKPQVCHAIDPSKTAHDYRARSFGDGRTGCPSCANYRRRRAASMSISAPLGSCSTRMHRSMQPAAHCLDQIYMPPTMSRWASVLATT